MQTRVRTEALPLEELPEQVIGPLREWIRSREQMRGQQGLEQPILGRIEVTYALQVRDDYPLIDTTNARTPRPRRECGASGYVKFLHDDPNGC